MIASRKTTVLIDGRVLNHGGLSGVQRYAHELLGASRELALPFDVAEPHTTSRYGRQCWEHLVLPRLAGRYQVLFCPANVAPLYVPRRTRLVVTIHSLSFMEVAGSYRWTFRNYYRLVVPQAMRRADAIITVSHTEAERIAAHFPSVAAKIRVIPLGVSRTFAPPREPRRLPVVLFVGSLGSAKNLHGLLAAFAEIRDKTACAVWIVGRKGSPFTLAPETAAVVARIGGDRVRWLGQISDSEELAAIYRSAALLVLPSFYESFGLAALEAAACGTPALVSDIHALREVMGDAAAYVNPCDVRAMADAILALLMDEKERHRLSERGIKRAAQFSWKQCAELTWDVLSEVAAGAQAAQTPAFCERPLKEPAA
jgi:glycosyltransferase involved in cell wall biosynthesis